MRAGGFDFENLVSNMKSKRGRCLILKEKILKINAEFSSLDLHQLNLSTATDSPELDSKRVTEIEIFYAIFECFSTYS